jgi:hypothetical protein
MIQATGTTTLGFIVWTVASTAVAWTAGVLAKWIELKRARTSFAFREAVSASFWPQGVFLAAGIVALLVVAYSAFVVRTTYKDHELLAKRNHELTASNLELQQKLEWRLHNVSTIDPVFPNIIYLLEAFHTYRVYAKGEPCVLRVTAPPDSMPLASAVAQFSNSVSGCFTFGPDALGNPDVEEVAMKDMVTGKIVFHMERDDKAADQLFNRLGNQIQLQSSYKPIPEAIRNFSVPVTGKVRVIWLQFGSGVKWNSEIQTATK